MVTHVSNIFAALADPTRLDILLRIAPQHLNVGEIAKEYSVSQPAITKQLNVLEDAGLIKRERQGRQQIVSPVPSALSQATAFLDKYESLLGSRLSAIETYLDGKSIDTIDLTKTAHMPENKMKLTQHINYPRSKVWSTYINAKDIPHWWTPPGSTLIDCQIEARKNGVWRFTVRAPSGQIKVLSGIFKEVEKENRLVYTDGFGDPHSARTESLVTIIFEDAADGGTVITKEVILNPRMHQLQKDYIDTVNQ